MVEDGDDGWDGRARMRVGNSAPSRCCIFEEAFDRVGDDGGRGTDTERVARGGGGYPLRRREAPGFMGEQAEALLAWRSMRHLFSQKLQLLIILRTQFDICPDCLIGAELYSALESKSEADKISQKVPHSE